VPTYATHVCSIFRNYGVKVRAEASSGEEKVTRANAAWVSGGFCGYRNIQMLISYIVGAEAFGAELFGNRVPPVFDIQDLIEAAWDMGYNPQGRIETGGIKGTRKFIGTPEVTLI